MSDRFGSKDRHWPDNFWYLDSIPEGKRLPLLNVNKMIYYNISFQILFYNIRIQIVIKRKEKGNRCFLWSDIHIGTKRALPAL